MTIHIDTCARMRIYEEPSGSFAVDGTGTMANFLDVPFIEGTVAKGLNEPMESPMHAMQHIDAQPIKVHMPKRGTLAFDANLAGLGLATGLRAQSALGRLLKIAMGGEFLGTSTTVNDAAATTSVIVFTSTSGFRTGGAVAFATGTGGRLEMREIKTIAGTTVTLKHALSSAPANGSTAYACATYHMTNRAVVATTYTSLQALYEGLEPDDRWLYLGGQIASPFKLSLSNGGIPRISFDWQFAQWLYADGVNTTGDFVGPALAEATYSNYRPLVIKDSELRFTDVGTSSISSTLINATSYEFNPNIVWQPQLAPGGTNNIIAYNRLRAVPAIAGSFVDHHEDQTWFTEMAEDDRRAFFLQIGSSPTLTTGGGVLLSAPCVQVTDVQRVPLDGLTGQKISWEGTVDADVSSTAENINTSAFRIHLF